MKHPPPYITETRKSTLKSVDYSYTHKAGEPPTLPDMKQGNKYH